ncbi:MAG: hypothetical protein JNK15_14740 [Planctomycetes bacterium]|nr:hypothetical protein [Planctomycetota bacterium]
MRASNKPQDPGAPGFPVVAGEFGAVVAGLWHGSLGRTVRCVPTRRTVAAPFGGGFVFGKWRVGQRAMAAAEWHWLHVLPMLGLATPQPLAFVGRGRRTLLVTGGVGGRALDAWWRKLQPEGRGGAVAEYAIAHVAPRVRALHGAGVCYRDLYWNHVFAADPCGTEPPTFLDVERVFRPRWRLRRWIVKDLAGLLASAPDDVPVRLQLRFLRAYLDAPVRGHRGLLRAIVGKAARIRRHAPRFG